MRLNFYILTLLITVTQLTYGQVVPDSTKTPAAGTQQEIPNEAKDVPVDKKIVEEAKELGAEIKLEKPLNVFAAAGASFRIAEVYSIAISPIDQTVQFDKTSPIFSSLTTGIIWNPVTKPFKVWYYKDKEKDWRYEYKRRWYAFALLINVFNLSYSGQQGNSALPIDVGFGVGYRKESLCVLATLEFTPIRQPRNYFKNQYKDQNKQLLYLGSEGPVPEISEDNSSIFTTKLIPALGIKVAYAFTNNSKD